MTLLVPTTSGGWKALAVVAQSAAAAAAFVGDLTIFEGSRAFGALYGAIWALAGFVARHGYCHYTRNKRARRLRPEITGPEEAVDVPRRFSGVWRRRMGQIRLCTFLLKLRVI